MDTTIKILRPVVTSWSYLVNENGNAIRLTLEGYGSCTPARVLQGFIDNLSPEQFRHEWDECERAKDVID